MKDIDKLIQIIPKLEPIDFIGLARLLKVNLIEEKDGKTEPRDFIEVLDDTLKAYECSNRDRKREILRIVKKAYASHTKNT